MNPASAEETRVSDLTIIPISEGVNTIDHFAPDNRNLEIIKSWRDNGDAHGYWVFLTMIAREKPQQGWEVVATDTGDQLDDTTRDFPHTGEDYIKSIRYAYGTVDEKPALLLISATRDLFNSRSLLDASKVTITIYALSASHVELGTTPYVFKKVSTLQPQEVFCNSDLALHKILNLPLPTAYAGNQNDGCP